ncbi:hypothetical protein [Peribacillus sp. V2I11]|uniref:hypothetical protein n=1 Tax=Peribacillus sp. V2I11 TaxID=3042277 RepID=UPI0027848FB0|nr:hypothetical protein [Peribacillus sp. V2I11]MDQ0880958.1 polyhydroxyalkanoate synthesis regulator phasin [Peribacillus sp. V2I11]
MAPLYKNEVRLNKPQDVRRMLSRVINYLLITGEMTNEKAKAINALSNTTLKSMEMGELQEELEQLKEVVQKLEGRNK